MVRRGLRLINDDPRPGIAALMEAAGVGDKYFTASSAAFTVCPRINAAGRMGSAHKALDLLLCDDEDTASLLADEINAMNIQRQKTETEIFASAVAMLSENPEMLNDKILTDQEEVILERKKLLGQRLW